MPVLLVPTWRQNLGDDWKGVPFGAAEFVHLPSFADNAKRPYVWFFDRLKVADDFPLADWYAYEK